MASYQDIEQRLISVEERMSFLFKFMKLQKMTPIGTAVLSLEEAFLESKHEQLERVAEEAARNFRARSASKGTSDPTSDSGTQVGGDEPNAPQPPVGSGVETFTELRDRLRSEGVI